MFVVLDICFAAEVPTDPENNNLILWDEIDGRVLRSAIKKRLASLGDSDLIHSCSFVDVEDKRLTEGNNNND